MLSPLIIPVAHDIKLNWDIDVIPIIEFTDYLFGRLLLAAPAQLWATQSDAINIAWTLQPNEKTASTEVATCPKRHFRSVLARIGHYYMDDQLYCGFTVRPVHCGDIKTLCHFYLANSADTGYWIRIYARKLRN